MNTQNTYIDVLCHECKDATDKKLSYLISRIRKGKLEFYCSRKCTDTSHSRRMRGKNNPNFNGKWYGPEPSAIFTTEERRERTYKQIEKHKENGTFDTILKKLQEGHRKYFATEEGKAKRVESGILGYLANSDGRRTSIEIKIAEELDRRGIEYEEQHNLGGKFVLDFFLPEYNIVIEADGDYWHNLPQNIARDKRKNAYIKACGFSLYRFWESEINADVEACVDFVLAEINEKEAVS